jgi:hypothetical protein
VQFGSTPATSATVLSSTSLSVVTPPGSPGPVDVTVTTPEGITATQNGRVTVAGTLADGTACAADTIPGAVTVTGATAR